MFNLSVILSLLCLTVPLLGRDYPAEVVRVIDGDTIVCNVELGLGLELRLKHVRLADLDAPERGTPEGEAARTFARETLAGKKVVLTTGKTEFDKYGRILAAVKIADADFGALLKSKGFAR